MFVWYFNLTFRHVASYFFCWNSAYFYSSLPLLSFSLSSYLLFLSFLHPILLPPTPPSSTHSYFLLHYSFKSHYSYTKSYFLSSSLFQFLTLQGLVSSSDVTALLRPHTALVTIMHSNNEVRTQSDWSFYIAFCFSSTPHLPSPLLTSPPLPSPYLPSTPLSLPPLHSPFLTSPPLPSPYLPSPPLFFTVLSHRWVPSNQSVKSQHRSRNIMTPSILISFFTQTALRWEMRIPYSLFLSVLLLPSAFLHVFFL